MLTPEYNNSRSADLFRYRYASLSLGVFAIIGIFLTIRSWLEPLSNSAFCFLIDMDEGLCRLIANPDAVGLPQEQHKGYTILGALIICIVCVRMINDCRALWNVRRTIDSPFTGRPITPFRFFIYTSSYHLACGIVVFTLILIVMDIPFIIHRWHPIAIVSWLNTPGLTSSEQYLVVLSLAAGLLVIRGTHYLRILIYRGGSL